MEYPDVPLCQSDGETIEEAIANGRDALEGSLKSPQPHVRFGQSRAFFTQRAHKCRHSAPLRRCAPE